MSTKLSERKRQQWFSLAGLLTIGHLVLWILLFAARSLLVDAGGVVVVDESNRFFVDALDWSAFILASPLYLIIAPRGFQSVSLDIAGMVVNACLVGFGLAGGIRLFCTKQFGIRFLFTSTTLVALSLFAFFYDNDNRIYVHSIAAILGLLLLSLVRYTAPTQR